MNTIRRIAILRALKLGDLLCTVPAMRALRAAHPFAEIRLIGLPWAAEFVRRYDQYLDGLFELPGFPGFPERPFDAHGFVRFLCDVQAWGPDLVLQLHGSGDLSNPLAMLLGGRQTAGFYLLGHYCPDPDRFVPYPDDLPEVDRHLRVLERLGIPAQGRHKETPVHDEDRRALTATLKGTALSAPAAPYVVVHAGASVAERRWPPERFAAVADDLAARGVQVVLTGGATEAHVTAAVRQRMRASCTDLTGRTDLGTLAALLEGAALLVSNDTGVMHIAEGVGTPLVAVSFDPESWRWAPQDAARFCVLPGGLRVTVEDVLRGVAEQLCKRTAGIPVAAARAGQTPDGGGGRSGGG
jgi:ADP-heptose:LPS heptosyltransferase